MIRTEINLVFIQKSINNINIYLNHLIVKITDNGLGMSPSVQKRIFDKFYRASSGDIHNVKGHGLGLSYVKKIVDLHKGEIKLESKINQGTTFLLSFPLE